MQQSYSWGRAGIAAAGMATSALVALNLTTAQAGDWKEDAISPVTNPVFFEDPQVNSEVRPIFARHGISDDLGGGHAELYALQARWAVTDRLAIIAVKDGYLNLDAPVGRTGGWMDIAAGLKYALIDDKENEFIVTPGLTYEFQWGNHRVFQGNGSGTWNPFVSVGKGFGKLRLLGNIGGVIPNDGADETTQLHYSVQVDYTTCRYFVPFVSWNAFTVLNEAKGLGVNFEGFDLFNFGAQKAEGYTESVIGVGFRSHLVDKLWFGAAYEFPISSPEGIFDNRVTVDFIWRF